MEEIPFGAFDSELMHQEIFIPEGFTATIEGDKIILTRIESEDEKIRKALIEYFNEQCDMSDWNGVYGYQVVAWLEKQDEQKPILNVPPREVILSIWDLGNEWKELTNGCISTEYGTQLDYIQKHWHESEYYLREKQSEQKLPIEKLPEEMKTIEESLGFTTQEECDEYNQMVSDLIMCDDDKDKPKFKVGDWVVYTGYLLKDSGKEIYVMQIASVEDDRYNFTDTSTLCFDSEKDMRSWTIQDARKGDVLAEDTCIFIIKKLNHDLSAEIYCCLYDDGDFDVNSTLVFDDTSTYPATKEQRDTLFAKMKETGYEWLEETKKLKKIELSDVGHEYYSELLKNDTSDNIADYAYQCVYCMSHDWTIENPTWDNVQSACRLGAKWQKKHDVSEDWSEEDEKMIGRVRGIIEAYAFSQSAVDVNGDLCEKKFIDVDIWLKSIKDRVYPKQEWKQENTDDLTDFENAMMHIGESFFGKNAGLDPNDIDVIKEQANTLLGLVPSKEWSEEDEEIINGITSYLCTHDSCELDGFNKWYDWLKSLKNRVQPQPKQEWRKNEKQMFADIITIVGKSKAYIREYQRELVDFLKFLKERYTWKPSDEQITVLELASKYERVFTPKQIDILIGLKEQLKKLKA